jgi:3-hydroxyacyl-[acyl-carrier-protein] dehydratase
MFSSQPEPGSGLVADDEESDAAFGAFLDVGHKFFAGEAAIDPPAGEVGADDDAVADRDVADFEGGEEVRKFGVLAGDHCQCLTSGGSSKLHPHLIPLPECRAKVAGRATQVLPLQRSARDLLGCFGELNPQNWHVMMAEPDAQLLDRLKIILRRDLKLGAEASIANDMSFFGSDIDLDSLDMLLLVTSVEKEFGVKIPNEAVGRTVFESVTTLAKFITDQGGTIKAAGDTTGQGSSAKAQANPLDRLPHREPFRFVSRITAHKAGEFAEGVWSISGSEGFFAGHFPGNPLVPGVLIGEALAQISGIAGSGGAGADVPDAGKLAHVDVRFDQAVAPPVELVLKSKLVRSMLPLQHFEVSAHVGDQTVARGSITLNRS